MYWGMLRLSIRQPISWLKIKAFQEFVKIWSFGRGITIFSRRCFKKQKPFCHKYRILKKSPKSIVKRFHREILPANAFVLLIDNLLCFSDSLFINQAPRNWRFNILKPFPRTSTLQSLNANSLFHCSCSIGNFRQIEKQILDGIIGDGRYDSRIRPLGINTTGNIGECWRPASILSLILALENLFLPYMLLSFRDNFSAPAQFRCFTLSV